MGVWPSRTERVGPRRFSTSRVRRLTVGLLGVALLPLTLATPASAATLTATSYTASNTNTGTAGVRDDWGFTTVSSATLSKVTMGMPTGTSGANRYLALNGGANYASTPDSTPNSIVGDIDIRAKVNLAQWTPAVQQYLVGKFALTGNQRSYQFRVQPDGTLQLTWSSDGSSAAQFAVNSTAATGIGAGVTAWVRVTLQVNDGAGHNNLNFYKSSDGVTWTPVGTTVVQSGTTSIFDSTADLEMGNRDTGTAGAMTGKIYYADVRNSIGANGVATNCSSAGVVNCFNPNNDAIGGSLWASSSATGETWTVNRSGTNLPADIASDLSVVKVTGLPAGGTANYRSIDNVASYYLPSATSIASGTAVSVGLMGFTNTNTAGSYTSAVTTYDNSGTPVSVDTATTAALAISGNIISTYSGQGSLINTATPGTSANIYPNGVAVNGSIVYVTDSSTNAVDALDTTTGLVTRVAGDGQYASNGNSGAATSAAIDVPVNVSVDGSGNLYIAEDYSQVLRKVTTGTGLISTVAGASVYGFSGDGGQATAAGFKDINSTAFNSAGDYYIADVNNNRIRFVNHGTNVISTVVGDGTGAYNGDGGAATSAEINSPRDVAVDSAGNLYIADTNNSRIRKVDTSGNISTVAGTGSAGFSGDGGLATAAKINGPYSIALDSLGDLFIADTGNNRIREVNTSGIISTVAGTGTASFSGDGGPATSAALSTPQYLDVDSAGNIYVCDRANFRLRKVNTSGIISTVVGAGAGPSAGDGGRASAANFYDVTGGATDSSGNIYVVDRKGSVVRKIDQWGTITAFAGIDVNNSGFSGDSGAATAAKLQNPQDVAVAANGTVYIADSSNNRIRAVSTSGVISSLANLSYYVSSVAVNPVTQDVWSADASCRIRRTTTGGATTTVAGTGTCSTTGDGGAALAATVNNPTKLAFDAAGDCYFIDSNNRVRKIDVTTGNINTVAGGGASTADNVSATSASFTQLSSLTVDNLGVIYVAERYRVRRFTDGGSIFTVAGNGSTGYSGDGAAAVSAKFVGMSANNVTYRVVSALVIANGQLYIGDNGGSAIRKVADIAPMAPNVNADSMSVAMNTPLTYPVESNDWDQDGAMDPNSVAITTAPAHGTAIVNTVQGSITNVTYTPTTSYTGADSFVYQACDSTLVLCNTAAVSVTIGSNQVTTVLGGLTEGLGSTIGFAPARGVRFKNYIFYSDVNLNVIRRYEIYSQQSVVVAGNGAPGSTNGTGQSVSFNTPKGLAIAPNGQLYIADNGNSLVRTLNTDGTVSSLSAGVTTPLGLTFGITGTLYAATGNTVKSWSGSSWVNFAGTGVTGTSGDGGAATSAQLNAPGGLTTAPNGDVYISDGGSCTVRKVNLAGTISAVAGQAGSCSFTGDGGAATSATLNNPVGITLDSTGALLISEYNDSKIRKVDTSGNITSVTITGTAPNGPVDVVPGTSTDFYVFNTGSLRGIYVSTAGVGTTVLGNGYGSYAGDGLAPLATQFSEGSYDASLTVDSAGNIYAAEGNGGTSPRSAIREATVATGLVSSLVTSTNANGFAFDGSGNLVYADYNACRVYRLNANLSTTVLAGTGTCSTSGDGGLATAATLNHPSGLTYDTAGNFYVSEYSGNVVRRVTAAGVISTVAGNGTAGLSGDGAAATAAQLNTPKKLAVDRNGNLLIVDAINNRIRMVDAKGVITTLAGTSGGFSGDGGLATAAKLTGLRGIAVDTSNNIYVADQTNRIRKIDGSGIINTVVGNGTNSFVDNTSYLSAGLNGTGDIALDNSGNLYISEVTNHRVRKASALASTATDNLTSASWSVVPGASGHANLREQFVATPSNTVTASKLTFTMPTGIAGTPSVVSAYGVSGTVTPSLSGSTLTLSFPSQSLPAGVAVSVAVEGWTNGGSNGAYSANATLYDSAGSTAIGWARSNVVNISSAGAPTASDPGYASVWMPSTTVTPSASSISINVNPASISASSGSISVTTGGNLNANSLGLGASVLTRTATPFSTFSPVSTGIGTGVVSGSFGADTWGSSATTTSGSVQGGAASGNYVGNTAGQQIFVTAANATNTYSLSARAKVDWLLPAGTYTSTLTYDLSPGS